MIDVTRKTAFTIDVSIELVKPNKKRISSIKSQVNKAMGKRGHIVQNEGKRVQVYYDFATRNEQLFAILSLVDVIKVQPEGEVAIYMSVFDNSTDTDGVVIR